MKASLQGGSFHVIAQGCLGPVPEVHTDSCNRDLPPTSGGQLKATAVGYVLGTLLGILVNILKGSFLCLVLVFLLGGL